MALAIPGPQGATGAAGSNGTNGVNAYTTVAVAFNMPAISATVVVTVGSSAWIGLNQTLYVESAGYMKATAKPSTTQVTLENLGYTGNASAAAVIAAGSIITAGGIQGSAGSLTGAAGGDLSGTYPNPQIAAGVITDADVAAANKDGAAGTASMRTLGTGAAQAAAGNDSRLTDSRAPTGAAGGSLTGTFPNPTLSLTGASAGTFGGSASIPVITITTEGRITALSQVVPSALSNFGQLGQLASANMNVTTDQAIVIGASTYIIRWITVESASTSLTTAAGGVYTAIAKGGTAIVAAGQVYSALTSSVKVLDLTLANTDVQSAATIYLSLTTAQGAPATARVTVWGMKLS